MDEKEYLRQIDVQLSYLDGKLEQILGDSIPKKETHTINQADKHSSYLGGRSEQLVIEEVWRRLL